MKNLNILQSGGGVFYSSVANPYSNAAIADQQVAAASSKSSSKDEGLIPKALMEKLSEKGIPTDVNKFMDMLADFEHKSSFGMGVNKRQLYRLQAYANQIIKQSEYLDAAEKRAEQNGALDEFAVDARGYLYISGENGKINKVHASEFDASKHMALTVGELLQQRKFNPNEVDNESIATTVGNNIGIEKINDYIQGIIRAVGTAEDASEAYVSLGSILGKEVARRPNDGQMEALKDLYELTQQIGPDAIFKVKDQFKSKNMDAAMSYIMSMLPNNIRTQLVARNVAAGGKYENSNKYAADIISMAAMAGNDVKMSHGIDYDASINKAAGTKAGETELKAQPKNLTGLEQLIQGTLGQRDLALISSKYPDISFTLHGTGMGKLMDAQNKLVNESILSQALEAGLGAMINTNNIYFGDQKITPHTLDSIIYDGNDVVNVWAPTNPDGSINFSLLEQYEAAKEHFKKNPQMSLQDRQAFLNANGIDGIIDQNGNITSGNMKQFVVLTGITSDEAFDGLDSNVFTSVLKGADKDQTFAKIKQIYALANKGMKNKDGQYQFPQGWWEWSTDLIAAPVFLQVSDTAQFDVGTVAGHGPLVNTVPYTQQIAQDQARQIAKPSTNLLYQ